MEIPRWISIIVMAPIMLVWWIFNGLWILVQAVAAETTKLTAKIFAGLIVAGVLGWIISEIAR